MHLRAESQTPAPPLSPSILGSLLGSEFVVEVAKPSAIEGTLFPDEQQYISRAAKTRRAEFATARICARRALARLGIAPCSLVPYADRSPRWPKGIIGSISHASGCCAVAVTDAAHVRSVGLDIEDDTALSQDLLDLVCTPAERDGLKRLNARERGLAAKLHFCAKEAFYKCQYPLTRRPLDFQDVDLAFNAKLETFRVASRAKHDDDSDIAPRVHGRFRRSAGYAIAVALLPARDWYSQLPPGPLPVAT